MSTKAAGKSRTAAVASASSTASSLTKPTPSKKSKKSKHKKSIAAAGVSQEETKGEASEATDGATVEIASEATNENENPIEQVELTEAGLPATDDQEQVTNEVQPDETHPTEADYESATAFDPSQPSEEQPPLETHEVTAADEAMVDTVTQQHTTEQSEESEAATTDPPIDAPILADDIPLSEQFQTLQQEVDQYDEQGQLVITQRGGMHIVETNRAAEEAETASEQTADTEQVQTIEDNLGEIQPPPPTAPTSEQLQEHENQDAMLTYTETTPQEALLHEPAPRIEPAAIPDNIVSPETEQPAVVESAATEEVDEYAADFSRETPLPPEPVEASASADESVQAVEHAPSEPIEAPSSSSFDPVDPAVYAAGGNSDLIPVLRSFHSSIVEVFERYASSSESHSLSLSNFVVFCAEYNLAPAPSASRRASTEALQAEPAADSQPKSDHLLTRAAIKQLYVDISSGSDFLLHHFVLALVRLAELSFKKYGGEKELSHVDKVKEFFTENLGLYTIDSTSDGTTTAATSTAATPSQPKKKLSKKKKKSKLSTSSSSNTPRITSSTVAANSTDTSAAAEVDSQTSPVQRRRSRIPVPVSGRDASHSPASQRDSSTTRDGGDSSSHTLKDVKPSKLRMPSQTRRDVGLEPLGYVVSPKRMISNETVSSDASSPPESDTKRATRRSQKKKKSKVDRMLSIELHAPPAQSSNSSSTAVPPPPLSKQATTVEPRSPLSPLINARNVKNSPSPQNRNSVNANSSPSSKVSMASIVQQSRLISPTQHGGHAIIDKLVSQLTAAAEAAKLATATATAEAEAAHHQQQQQQRDQERRIRQLSPAPSSVSVAERRNDHHSPIKSHHQPHARSNSYAELTSLKQQQHSPHGSPILPAIISQSNTTISKEKQQQFLAPLTVISVKPSPFTSSSSHKKSSASEPPAILIPIANSSKQESSSPSNKKNKQNKQQQETKKNAQKVKQFLVEEAPEEESSQFSIPIPSKSNKKTSKSKSQPPPPPADLTILEERALEKDIKALNTKLFHQVNLIQTRDQQNQRGGGDDEEDESVQQQVGKNKRNKEKQREINSSPSLLGIIEKKSLPAPRKNRKIGNANNGVFEKAPLLSLPNEQDSPVMGKKARARQIQMQAQQQVLLAQVVQQPQRQQHQHQQVKQQPSRVDDDRYSEDGFDALQVSDRDRVINNKQSSNKKMRNRVKELLAADAADEDRRVREAQLEEELQQQMFQQQHQHQQQQQQQQQSSHPAVQQQQQPLHFQHPPPQQWNAAPMYQQAPPPYPYFPTPTSVYYAPPPQMQHAHPHHFVPPFIPPHLQQQPPQHFIQPMFHQQQHPHAFHAFSPPLVAGGEEYKEEFDE